SAVRASTRTPLVRPELLDLLPGVDLVADELQAGGQLGHVQAAGGVAREVEAELLQLVLRDLAADAEPLEHAHGLADRLVAALHDLELALEQAAVLGEVGALEAGARVRDRGCHRRPPALRGLLLQVRLPRGPRRRQPPDSGPPS